MTLIEVMVVMVIMATMAGAAAFAVMRAWNGSRKHETETRARTIQAAASAYLLEGNEDCPDVEDLAAAGILDPTTEHADGWGRSFTIECEETTVHVRSRGADATLGTEDDIGF